MLFLPGEPETPSAEENFQGLGGRVKTRDKKGCWTTWTDGKLLTKPKRRKAFQRTIFEPT